MQKRSENFNDFIFSVFFEKVREIQLSYIILFSVPFIFLFQSLSHFRNAKLMNQLGLKSLRKSTLSLFSTFSREP